MKKLNEKDIWYYHSPDLANRFGMAVDEMPMRVTAAAHYDSDEKEVRIAFAMCNPKVSKFSKKEGREIAFDKLQNGKHTMVLKMPTPSSKKFRDMMTTIFDLYAVTKVHDHYPRYFI